MQCFDVSVNTRISTPPNCSKEIWTFSLSVSHVGSDSYRLSVTLQLYNPNKFYYNPITNLKSHYKNNCEILKSHSKGYSLLLWDYNKINSGYRVTEWQRAYMSHSPHDWHYSEREGSYFYIAIVERRYSITRVFILTSKHWNSNPY